MNFCPNCGTRIESGVNFCPNCGHEILSENGRIEQPSYGSSTENSVVVGDSLFKILLPLSLLVNMAACCCIGVLSWATKRTLHLYNIGQISDCGLTAGDMDLMLGSIFLPLMLAIIILILICKRKKSIIGYSIMFLCAIISSYFLFSVKDAGIYDLVVVSSSIFWGWTICSLLYIWLSIYNSFPIKSQYKMLPVIACIILSLIYIAWHCFVLFR